MANVTNPEIKKMMSNVLGNGGAVVTDLKNEKRDGIRGIEPQVNIAAGVPFTIPSGDNFMILKEQIRGSQNFMYYIPLEDGTRFFFAGLTRGAMPCDDQGNNLGRDAYVKPTGEVIDACQDCTEGMTAFLKSLQGKKLVIGEIEKVQVRNTFGGDDLTRTQNVWKDVKYAA